MVRLLLLAALTVLAGCYTSEGSGRLVQAAHGAKDFSAVALGGEGELTIVPGDDFQVAVSAEDNVLPSIRIERDGDTLVLGRDVDWIDGVRPTLPIHFHVSMPTLAAVSVSGSGTATVRPRAADQLRLSVSGSGRIHAADLGVDDLALTVRSAGVIQADGVQARQLRCEAHGAGRITATGDADQVAIEISGTGLYRGSRLLSSEADVEVTGAGQAFVWAETRLDARANGRGRVVYRGAPTVTSAVQRDGVVTALADARIDVGR